MLWRELKRAIGYNSIILVLYSYAKPKYKEDAGNAGVLSFLKELYGKPASNRFFFPKGIPQNQLTLFFSSNLPENFTTNACPS